MRCPGPAACAAAVLVTVAAAAADARAAGLDGQHWRLGTPRGIVHVWKPAGYEPHTAGTVVYIHGYYTSADSAWEEDHLGAQFRDSRRNALFVVPEAPSSGEDEVVWPSLEALLATVAVETGTRPSGPLVVIGHSGAWRTVQAWLPQRAPAHLVLLDAMYGRTTPIRTWLASGAARRSRLTMVAADTLPKAQAIVHGLRGVVRLSRVPDGEAALSARVRQARVLLLRSQYEHRAIVTGGRVIPLLLRLGPLAPEPGGAGRQSRRPSTR